MSTLLASITATALDAAWTRLSCPAAWPDLESGFAHRLLTAANLPLPDVLLTPHRTTDMQALRRTPELAAFGYVLGSAAANDRLHEDWAGGYARLTHRDVFPTDRNSFIYSPVELLGIALGASACRHLSPDDRQWLGANIHRGFAEGRFAGPIAELFAFCAGHALAAQDQPHLRVQGWPVQSEVLDTADLCIAAALAIAFPDLASGAETPWIDVPRAEQEVVRRALSKTISVRDGCDAAAVYVCLRRVVDRAVIHPGFDADPVTRVVALCRRFQLFADRLKQRQRNRPPLDVKDEYDLQDLLHAMLRLHFDDVRPEEWTPSYAGNSSRIDFYLSQERTVVEAKMTRTNLGQKEVANELIIDKERYSRFPNVDDLVCFVYDPERRCPNPTALESDLAQDGKPLRVTVVVCPRGI